MALPLPAFAAEMGLPHHRPKLWLSIRSGYAIVLTLAAFAIAAHAWGLRPLDSAVVALISLKLVTNTLAWAALRRDVLALEACGLNLLADIVTMTGAIYWTGGIQSPLVPIYAIELTVVALLSNVGVTIATSVLTFGAYVSMLALIRAGVLDPPATVIEIAGGANDTYTAIAIVFVAFVLAVPTGFAAAILRQLRERERALVAKNEELVDAGRQKSQFMANVTHELRTPIHGISGLADLVEAGVYGPVTEQQKTAVRDMKASVLSLLRLIDDLLTLARDDAGKLEHRPAAIDVREVLESVHATVGFLRGTRTLEVTLDAPPELPPLETDRAKLVQILVNLVANAVKFTPDGGHVVLRARALGDRIELAVIDDGIGIAERELEKIWEPFRQVDGSPERRYGGTGLGLALVRRLCAVIGAEVRVESALGRGSTFRVLLPRRPQERRSAT